MKLQRTLFLTLTALLLGGMLTASAQKARKERTKKTDFYHLSATRIDGTPYNFDSLHGKYVLIVNTASKCGFTKQYAALEQLANEYADRLVVLGFPCNQFGEQEAGTNADIAAFCQANYGVTFPMMEKIDVKGKEQHPVYHWLTTKASNGWNTEVPSWNFCKYLISPQGKLLKFFPSIVTPMSEDITDQLKP
jgi:glutathione peroxidase